ncbi:hypothetical protein DPMN_146384 [Dreissena polymorpha]|uniref:Ig-like domain-containing protein n=1 Tax=Dreissena polymorpha TaxID=45954 RepID=A0A9D4F8I4_DREPO|nr:hypothetical protein DPMN_146384 [Dreissena polymorpha]
MFDLPVILGEVRQKNFISQGNATVFGEENMATSGEGLKIYYDCKSKEMEQVIQDDNECSYDELPESEDDTDKALVHKAMGILRRRIIENNPKFDDFFYAPEEIKLSDQKQFVESLLYKAVCWSGYRNLVKRPVGPEEALPLHFGWADACDSPKCGLLGFIQEFVGEGVVAMKDYVQNVTREYFQNNSGVERTIVLAPPEILTPPGNKAVTVAERVVLACSVGGDPPPKVVWLKNGSPVKLSDRIRQLNTGSLVINDSTVLCTTLKYRGYSKVYYNVLRKWKKNKNKNDDDDVDDEEVKEEEEDDNDDDDDNDEEEEEDDDDERRKALTHKRTNEQTNGRTHERRKKKTSARPTGRLARSLAC